MNLASEFLAGAHRQPENKSPVAHAAAPRASKTQVGSSDGDKERSAELQPTIPSSVLRVTPAGNASPSKQAASKMDWPQLIMTLHSRLAQAEARLALSSPMINMHQFTHPWPDQSVTPVTTSAEAVSAPQFNPTQMQDLHMNWNLPVEGLNTSVGDATIQQSNNEWFNQLLSDTSALQFDVMAPTMPTDFSVAKSLLEENNLLDINSISHEPSSSSHSDSRSETVSTISAGLFSRLSHASFFDVFYPVMPIVNQSRFQAEMAQASCTIEVQALSHALGALGALAMPEFAYVHENCYNQARILLDVCERQEDGSTLININTLQTCVLLTFYEFKRTNFARAWMTLGRAIRLGKMMDLDRIDDSPATAEDSGLRVPLPIASNPAELEERYRTFWLLYVFDAFAGIRTNSVPAIDAPQVSELPENTYLSSFAGTIIMISLYRRCFDHIKSSLHQGPSYPFWVIHYRIDKSIRDCRSKLLTRYVVGQNADDPLSLTLRMNLAAVEVCLHEPAITKVEQEQLPTALSAEVIVRCQYATTDIVEAIQLGQHLMGKQLEAFRQSSLFFIWPITMAIQACFRMLSYRENDISPHVNSLRILSNSMRELIDAEHIPTALLKKVDCRIAEVERPGKKRKCI
ncbi:MAG: hypothetical protein Q9187_000563 [Circinaria calcarea]